MIELDAVTFRYPEGNPVFKDYSWQVLPRQTWAVVGSSGCGKTTLLYLIAGLRLPDSGAVKIGGVLLTRPRPRTGLILQDYGLLPWASVRDNVRLGLRLRQFYGPDGRHAPKDEAVGAVAERSEEWIQRLGLSAIASSYPGQISGGQRQRTAIARTLALNPDLLLMDEPFASLDAATREALQSLLRQLIRERSLTTVIVTHSIEEAALLGEKILVLNRTPNTSPTIIDNPGGLRDDFQKSQAFQRVCDLLRSSLEAAL